MTDDFYLTLPSHSSLQEFPQNANSNFKVRLPELIRLTEGDWKVALASISVPDPKNALPSWSHDDLTLFNYTCYYADKNNINRNKMGFQTAFQITPYKKPCRSIHDDSPRFSQRTHSTYTKTLSLKTFVSWMVDGVCVKNVLARLYYQDKLNVSRTRKKSEPQMGFEPTTLRDLFGCSNH